MRLSRPLSPSLSLALDALYPHLQNATDCAKADEPPPTTTKTVVPSDEKDTGLTSLPRLSKFFLVAFFLASTNPPKSDLRIFGRGLDEMKKRKRRTSGNPTKTKGELTKDAERLLGPTSFTLDGMLAILGARTTLITGYTRMLPWRYYVLLFLLTSAIDQLQLDGPSRWWLYPLPVNVLNTPSVRSKWGIGSAKSMS